MYQKRYLSTLLLCLVAFFSFCIRAQVISSLNEQNTKIPELKKEAPKKQTQFSAQNSSVVKIDTTTAYYAFLDSAQYHINLQHWSTAENFIRQAIKSEPSNPNNSLLISNLATLQRYEGKLEDAAKNYTLAIDMTPNAVTLLNNRASLYIEMNKISEAVADYQRILKLEPENEEARYNIGMLLLENKDFKNAENQFVDLLRYNPKSLLYNQGMAFLYKATGNYSKAAANFSDVIKSSPTVSLLANRADCFLMIGKLSEAADDINSAIQIEPNDGYLYLLRAKLKKLRYENEESQKDLQLAIDHGVDPALIKEALK